MIMQDAIARAIQQKWHSSENANLNKQTWDDFEKVAKEKKVVLFGSGRGADYYFYKFKDRAKVEIVVDNDTELQGLELQQILWEELPEKYRELKICDVEILDNYKQSDIVVLVCSLKYYKRIVAQLENIGITNVFALLPMEANARKKEITAVYQDRSHVYMEEACSKEICKNKIVFFTMCDYAGHGKEIARQLLQKEQKFDLVWLVDDLRVEVPQGIRVVWKKNERQCLLEMETAKMWICDTGINYKYVKREGQIYIQIKHWASVTLKNFGYDLARARKDADMLKLCQYDSELIDYIMTGSEFDTKTCRSGFSFKGEIIQVGSPRTDILFRPENALAVIRKRYNLQHGERILLYAPTFRCAKAEVYKPEVVRVDLNYEVVKECLEKKFGGEWRILLRLHPVVAKQSKNISCPSFVIDVSDYPDSEELVAAAEIMITDYSSIMFEPAFVGKKVFLFATDRRDYVNEERELLIEYDSLPFSIAESNEELAINIMQFEEKNYNEKLQSFMKKYGVCEDGYAGKRAADFIVRFFKQL